MKPSIRIGRIRLAVLVLVLLASTPSVALARDLGPTLPPPPEWPIIGPVLRWLGFESPVEAAPTFDPNRPEHRLSTLKEAQALWEMLAPNTPVRVITRQEDVNALIRQNLQGVQGLRDVSVVFESKGITLKATLERSLLEREGLTLPFFIRAQEISVEITVALSATNCTPTLTVRRVRIGRLSLPLRGIAQEALNETLAQEWLPTVCVERVFMLPGEFAVEGYRR